MKFHLPAALFQNQNCQPPVPLISQSYIVLSVNKGSWRALWQWSSERAKFNNKPAERWLVRASQSCVININSQSADIPARWLMTFPHGSPLCQCAEAAWQTPTASKIQSRLPCVDVNVFYVFMVSDVLFTVGYIVFHIYLYFLTFYIITNHF